MRLDTLLMVPRLLTHSTRQVKRSVVAAQPVLREGVLLEFMEAVHMFQKSGTACMDIYEYGVLPTQQDSWGTRVVGPFKKEETCILGKSAFEMVVVFN